MSLQQPRRGRVLLLAAALLVAACSTPPPQPESMRDPQANFAAYRTYGWQPVPQVDGKDAPLKLLDQNIRAAVAAELQKRGYVAAATDPDHQYDLGSGGELPARRVLVRRVAATERLQRRPRDVTARADRELRDRARVRGRGDHIDLWDGEHYYNQLLRVSAGGTARVGTDLFAAASFVRFFWLPS